MAATIAPVVEIIFDNTLTFGGTTTATITLPTNSSYFLLGAIVRGTNAGTTVTIASDGQTLVNGVTVGNATAFVPCNFFNPLTGTMTVAVGGAGTITYCSLLIRGDTGRSLTIAVA